MQGCPLNPPRGPQRGRLKQALLGRRGPLPGAHLHVPASSAQPLTLLTGLGVAKGSSGEVIVIQKDSLRGQGGRRRPGARGRLREPAGVAAAGQRQSKGASSRQAGGAALPPPPAPPAGEINGAAAGPAPLGVQARGCGLRTRRPARLCAPSAQCGRPSALPAGRSFSLGSGRVSARGL